MSRFLMCLYVSFILVGCGGISSQRLKGVPPEKYQSSASAVKLPASKAEIVPSFFEGEFSRLLDTSKQRMPMWRDIELAEKASIDAYFDRMMASATPSPTTRRSRSYSSVMYVESCDEFGTLENFVEDLSTALSESDESWRYEYPAADQTHVGETDSDDDSLRLCLWFERLKRNALIDILDTAPALYYNDIVAVAKGMAYDTERCRSHRSFLFPSDILRQSDDRQRAMADVYSDLAQAIILVRVGYVAPVPALVDRILVQAQGAHFEAVRLLAWAYSAQAAIVNGETDTVKAEFQAIVPQASSAQDTTIQVFFNTLQAAFADREKDRENALKFVGRYMTEQFSDLYEEKQLPIDVALWASEVAGRVLDNGHRHRDAESAWKMAIRFEELGIPWHRNHYLSHLENAATGAYDDGGHDLDGGENRDLKYFESIWKKTQAVTQPCISQYRLPGEGKRVLDFFERKMKIGIVYHDVLLAKKNKDIYHLCNELQELMELFFGFLQANQDLPLQINLRRVMFDVQSRVLAAEMELTDTDILPPVLKCIWDQTDCYKEYGDSYVSSYLQDLFGALHSPKLQMTTALIEMMGRSSLGSGIPKTVGLSLKHISNSDMSKQQKERYIFAILQAAVTAGLTSNFSFDVVELIQKETRRPKLKKNISGICSGNLALLLGVAQDFDPQKNGDTLFNKGLTALSKRDAPEASNLEKDHWRWYAKQYAGAGECEKARRLMSVFSPRWADNPTKATATSEATFILSHCPDITNPTGDSP